MEFTTKEASLITGISIRNIHYLCRELVIIPEIRNPKRRTPRLFSLENLFQLRTLAFLFDSGFDMTIAKFLIRDCPWGWTLDLQPSLAILANGKQWKFASYGQWENFKMGFSNGAIKNMLMVNILKAKTDVLDKVKPGWTKGT